MEKTKLNVAQKIVECRKVLISASKDSKGFGYDYISGGQLISKIRPKMDELGLLLTVSTSDPKFITYDYINSKGAQKTDFVVTINQKYTWINADDVNDKIECDFVAFGQQDDISKAYGSALTYSERYFLLKSMLVPTEEDDPDKKETLGNVSKTYYNQGNNGNGYSNNGNNNYGYAPQTPIPQGNQNCSICNKGLKPNEVNFSTQKFGKLLCFNCQKKQG